MTGKLLCDASVVLKWFHEERETEVAEARRLLDAHRFGEIRLRLLELTLYEVANIAVRRLRWDKARAGKVAGALWLIDPRPLGLDSRRLSDAVELAATHPLTVYDSAYWAIARATGILLVTADQALLDAGAGKSPTEAASELGEADT